MVTNIQNKMFIYIMYLWAIILCACCLTVISPTTILLYDDNLLQNGLFNIFIERKIYLFLHLITNIFFKN